MHLKHEPFKGEASAYSEQEQDQVKTDQVFKDHEENKNAEMDKELVTEKDKETNNISKPQFKCKTCGAKFKKEITMNKHYNTKHEEQSFKVWHLKV